MLLYLSISSESEQQDVFHWFRSHLPSTPLAPHLFRLALPTIEFIANEVFSNGPYSLPQQSYISAKPGFFTTVLQITNV